MTGDTHIDCDPRALSPLVLAYVGDAVYELHIRTKLAAEDLPVREIHHRTVALVRASAQAHMAHAIEPALTEEEHDVWRRARNAKSGTVPRSADVVEYRHSTAFEAVIGYLYLAGRQERLVQLIETALGEADKGT